MKYLYLRLSRLLLLLCISLCLILCLNYDNKVRAETPETYKPTDTFITETIKTIKSHIQELPANPKYVMFYDILAKRYYFYFSTKGDELHSYRYVYGNARQTYIKIRGKNVVRIYTDNNQNIQISDFVSNLDENIQNEDFTRFIFNTATLGNGLSFNKKFVLLEEKFNDGGMTSQDKGFMSGLFQGLINALLAPLNLIKGAVDAVKGAVSSIGSMITGAITSMSSAITGALTTLGNFIIDGLKGLFIPSQQDLDIFFADVREFMLLNLGAIGSAITFIFDFVKSLTTGAKNLVIDLPPLSIFGQTVVNLDYDLRQITTTYKTLYDLYYNFVSFGLVVSTIGYMISTADTFFDD